MFIIERSSRKGGAEFRDRLVRVEFCRVFTVSNPDPNLRERSVHQFLGSGGVVELDAPTPNPT